MMIFSRLLAVSSLAAWPLWARWMGLFAVSLALIGVLTWVGLPAAVLLVAMFSAILLSLAGGAVRLPEPLFMVAQGIVGLMVTNAFTPSVLAEIAGHWPVVAAGTVFTLGASALLAWGMVRIKALPGTTAIWGFSPGGATAMTIMSASYGADMRLVALAQYLRVVACTVLATLIAHYFGSGEAPHMAFFPALPWGAFGVTVAVLAGAVVFALWFKVPAGAMLFAMMVGTVLHLSLTGDGAFTAVLPPWLLTFGYSLIGWAIGMRFTAETVVYAARLIPRLMVSVLILLALCAGFGALLSAWVGIDPLTAYLATSPGGVDAIAIIASSLPHVDMPFIMSMQLARFFLSLVLGAALARFLSRRVSGGTGG